DGIRVRNVTGVQTCALPIWTPVHFDWSGIRREIARCCTYKGLRVAILAFGLSEQREHAVAERDHNIEPFTHTDQKRIGVLGRHEIGRASCRESLDKWGEQ